MQLDKTRIAVRERGVLETFDLALHVCRMHFKPLCLAMLIGALPWAIANFLLIYWMLPSDLDTAELAYQAGYYPRYIWTMAVLVTIEAPLASSLATVYLGKALFVEQPSITEAIREVIPMTSRLTWYHLFLRGILPAICLVIIIDRDQMFSGSEVLLLLLFMAVVLRRATAPFLNEIILLERNPLRSNDPSVVTIHRRSSMLHGPASGNLVSLAFVAGIYSIVITACLASIMFATQMILLSGWKLDRVMPYVIWPLAMWVTVGYLTAVRFLSYLDLRIRHEGWEVELRMRAEGNRLLEAMR